MPDLDAIIIGAGHNGLTCAAYLGMAGLKVRMFERRDVVGGACVTEEFHPGFRNSTAAYTVSLLQPKVIRDLKLAAHGLRIVERRAQNFLPLPDGRYLLTGEGRTEAGIAKFSARDAARYPAYAAEIGRVADVLRSLILAAPPNLRMDGWRDMIGSIGAFGALGRKLWRGDALGAALRMFRQSAGAMLDGWFESDPIKAVLGFDAVVGNLASPYSPGSAYVLLHHAFGEVNGKRGVWGHAMGGMGAITQALARAAGEAGVRIDTGAPVREVLIEGGSACGVVLQDGTVVRARAVIANVDPRTLLADMVPAEAVPRAARARMRDWKAGSGTFRMNVALSRLPDFTALPGAGDHLTAGIILAPSLAYMDEAYRDGRAYGWSKKPIVEMVIPSTLDDTLAPPGAHVASLFCQHVSAQLPDGLSWDAHRETVADLMIDTVETYAPGFKASVIARQSLAPPDLQRIFGLPDGDIFHGRMTLDQLFAARPMRGYADYRMPVGGLYLCGAGAHPGGGVTGAPGHNAAQAVLADLARRNGMTRGAT
ncbi:MAG TPA: NAD(P)/FAD-dependent oxidoreductase [Xanthobacteraceae bacterium]|jgi:phytoene dehydrogenase-like protein|nr:NAD(P)/FAD-dependent oxidoreductase [Xanthobacteraceae bacterium]